MEVALQPPVRGDSGTLGSTKVAVGCAQGCTGGCVLLSGLVWGVLMFISGVSSAFTLHIPCGLCCRLAGGGCSSVEVCSPLFRVFPRAHLISLWDTALPSLLKVMGSQERPGVHLGVTL